MARSSPIAVRRPCIRAPLRAKALRHPRHRSGQSPAYPCSPLRPDSTRLSSPISPTAIAHPEPKTTAWSVTFVTLQAVSLVVWLRDVVGTLDHQHRPWKSARVERWAAAGVGEVPILPQPLVDDLGGGPPPPPALAAGRVGLV